MGDTPLPATAATDQVFFELDRLERTADDRLELSGRWFGVRGRRFVRPTLTLSSGQEELRSLADLEHKPWAAEDGAEWHAAFPWQAEEVAGAQLAVAPDIAVQLPSPGSNGNAARRLVARSTSLAGRPARPRRAAATRPSAKRNGTGGEAPGAGADRGRERGETPVPPRPSRQVREARREIEAMRQQFADARRELEQTRQELAAAQAERDEVKAALTRRDAVVQDLRSSLSAREGDDRKQGLEQRAAELAERDSGLEQRRQELDEQRYAVERQQSALGRQQSVLQEQRAALEWQQTGLERQETRLEERQTVLDQRQFKLDQREQELTKREHELETRGRDLDRRGRELAASPGAARVAAPAVARADPRLASHPEPPVRLRAVWVTWLQRTFAVVFLIVPILIVAILTKLI